MRRIWTTRFALLLFCAAAAGLSTLRAASYAKADAGDHLFSTPSRLRIEIPDEGMKVLRVAALHARVDQLAKEAIAGLPKNHAARSQIEEGAEFLKARITSRAQFVAQQLVAPARPVQLAGPSELKLVNWTYKGGAPLPAASSRLMQGNRQIIRVTGRGPGSTGAWRSTLLLGAGRYEFTGLARTEGIMAQPGETNGVILRISGERSAEGITVTDEWKTLRYEFEVSGVEDVELICEFRGAQGMGWFDVSTLRLARLARE